MNRMNTTLVTGLLLIGMGVFPPYIKADESYIPSYSSTPSAVVTPATPRPTPVFSPSASPILVRGTCTIKVTRAIDDLAPAEVKFITSSTANGKPVTAFAYDFGDGTAATGSGSISHRYNQAGTYVITADPLIGSNFKINPCKISITLKASSAQSSVPQESVPTSTQAAVIARQPETGPSSGYWVSMGGLFIIWLGAELWYRHYRPQTG